MKPIQITIDGPSASGKSTVAKRLAQILGYIYIDTGAMYRAVTLSVQLREISLQDLDEIEAVLPHLTIEFVRDGNTNHILVNGRDMTAEIRSSEVTQDVSEISAMPFVRDYLVQQQRAMASEKSVVMDGRDTGSVVLPNADVKFYLTASVDERARRRFEENRSRGLVQESLEEIQAAIITRDDYDSKRQHSPLIKTDDMIEIDSTNLSVDDLIEYMLQIIQEKIGI